MKSDYEQLKEDYEKLLEKCNSIVVGEFWVEATAGSSDVLSDTRWEKSLATIKNPIDYDGIFFENLINFQILKGILDS